MIHLSHNRRLHTVPCVNGDADLETIGALLADKTRATIISTLLNGGLTAASALADRAGGSGSTGCAASRWPRRSRR